MKIVSSSSDAELAALAIRATTGLSLGGDTFTKVRQMINDMLDKLQKQQSEDMKKDAWCRSEVASTNLSLTAKMQKVNKETVALSALSASYQEVNTSIMTLTRSITKMKSELLKAQALRAQEKEKAAADMIMYKEDSRVINDAITVLKRVYNDPMAAPDKDGYKVSASGSSVVALLQSASDNFVDLVEKTKKNEKNADRDFLDLQRTSSVSLASFQKDLSYKTEDKTKMDADIIRSQTDLASYQKEAGALRDYMKELDTTCNTRPPTFEERQAKRDAELANLKEALDILSNDANFR